MRFSYLKWSVVALVSAMLKEIQRRIAITTIFVTHDQEEALTLSDRIAIIDHGKLVQLGQPEAVYERPENVFAARFLGDANVFKGKVGEIVRIRECRPLSKTKSWEVLVEAAKA